MLLKKYLSVLKIVSLLALMIIFTATTVFAGGLEKWSNTTSMNQPRGGAAVVEHNGIIYMMGGVVSGDPISGFVNSTEMSRINSDGSLGRWVMTSSTNFKRAFSGAAYLKGYIYLLGGSNSENWMQMLRQVERAKIKQDGTLGNWKVVASLTTPRRGVTAVAFENTIYALGGYNGTFLRTVESAVLDDANNLSQWSVLKSAMTTGRYIHGATSIKDKVFVIGGHMMGAKSATASSEWANITSDGTITHWNNWDSLKHDRFLNGVAAVKDYIVVVGGYSGTYLKSVEMAIAPTKSVTGNWFQAPPLIVERASAAVVSHGDYIYVIGGSNKEKYLSEVEYTKLVL